MGFCWKIVSDVYYCPLANSRKIILTTKFPAKIEKFSDITLDMFSISTCFPTLFVIFYLFSTQVSGFIPTWQRTIRPTWRAWNWKSHQQQPLPGPSHALCNTSARLWHCAAFSDRAALFSPAGPHFPPSETEKQMLMRHLTFNSITPPLYPLLRCGITCTCTSTCTVQTGSS